jgi:hypothetical protein
LSRPAFRIGLYAEALGGTEPREVERAQGGGNAFETTAVFEGIQITILGVVGRDSTRT